MNTKRPYNVWKRCYTTLTSNEIYCYECNGKGGFQTIRDCANRDYIEYVSLHICYRCSGSGKLDWISRAINNDYIQTSIIYTRKKNTNDILQVECKGPMVVNINKLYSSINYKENEK